MTTSSEKTYTVCPLWEFCFAQNMNKHDVWAGFVCQREEQTLNQSVWMTKKKKKNHLPILFAPSLHAVIITVTVPTWNSREHEQRCVCATWQSKTAHKFDLLYWWTPQVLNLEWWLIYTLVSSFSHDRATGRPSKHFQSCLLKDVYVYV